MDCSPLTSSCIPRASLRVAIVTETYPPEVNGVAMTIYRMVIGVLERGHRVQLIRPRQVRHHQPVKSELLEEVLLASMPIPGYAGLRIGLPATTRLTRLWAKERPDIVHVVTEGPLGWSAVKAALKLNAPCSTDFHTNFHSYSKHYGAAWLKRPIAAYLRAIHNRADCTLVPTKELRDELAREGLNGLRVVARGVDTQLFHPERRSALLRQTWRVEPDQPVVIYVGRLAAEKNLPLVVEAFAAMRSVRPDARLVFVGDGPERAALQAAHPEFVFAGMRREEELAAYYASGDILLFPSVTETYGNVTVEAMASGLAVIAYDYAAASEHIRHGHNGLVAAFDDAAEFMSLAANLVNDAPRIKQFGLRARATAERIDWRDINDEFEATLLEVASRGNRRIGQEHLQHAAHRA
jgi:glycosyltransferase involved in cell wall biosynthesis